MSGHAKRIVHCSSPGDPHAFDTIPAIPRRGDLDEVCPLCRGHGQWNSEIDLNSFRCKRVICGRCDGRGWIETDGDMVPSPDTQMTPEGYPKWVTRLDPPED